jgi:septum formation inhibitor MinC
MASKSRDVRIEQRRILEKKLELRLQKLEKLGVTKEKIKSDPLVKNLKSQIRETNTRIAAIDKNTLKIEELKQAKIRKLEEKTAPKEVKAAPEKEAKPKKKAAAGDKEAKKKPVPAAEGDAPKKPRKKKEDAPAA